MLSPCLLLQLPAHPWLLRQRRSGWGPWGGHCRRRRRHLWKNNWKKWISFLNLLVLEVRLGVSTVNSHQDQVVSTSWCELFEAVDYFWKWQFLLFETVDPKRIDQFYVLKIETPRLTWRSRQLNIQDRDNK